MTTEAPATETVADSSPSTPAVSSVDAQIRAFLDAQESGADEQTDQAQEEAPEETSAAKAAPKKAEPPKTEAPSAKAIREKAAALTKIEVDLAAKRGEIDTRERVFAEKLAKADQFDKVAALFADDPVAALAALGLDEDAVYDRLVDAHLKSDPAAKKLTAQEKRLAELEAKLDAQEKAKAAAAEEEAKVAEIVKQGKANVAAYLSTTAAGADRWPTLQTIDEEELAQAANDFGLRRAELTGRLPSYEEINNALEKEAARILAEKRAAEAQSKASPRPQRTGTKTITPEATSDRGATKKLTVEDKMRAYLDEHVR